MLLSSTCFGGDLNKISISLTSVDHFSGAFKRLIEGSRSSNRPGTKMLFFPKIDVDGHVPIS